VSTARLSRDVSATSPRRLRDFSMLSDVQIERYCRQIILPGIGSGGQERLLESSVALHGEGDAFALCASYLAGAGVGTLAVERFDESFAAMIARRNPDTRVTGAAETTLVVALGSALPARIAAPSALVWGASDDSRVRLARFGDGRACLECLRGLADPGRVAGNDGALGTLVALEALRVLLGLVPPRGASLVEIDLVHGESRSTPFPSRPGCTVCSQGG